MKQKNSISAMILAAGRGERMKPLTDSIPKPLIKVNGTTLIEHQIKQLAAAGIKKIVINVAYLGQMIVDYLGFGQKWGVDISYLFEPVDAYGTGGGIKRALDWLSDPFIVVSADVFADYDYHSLLEDAQKKSALSHLILVPNPAHHTQGDFSLTQKGLICDKDGESYTYTGICSCRKSLFNDITMGQNASLLDIWKPAIRAKKVSGKVYYDNWYNINTPALWKSVNTG